MKKLLFWSMALAGVLFLTGCSDSPKDVAVKWGKALVAGDLKTANKYSTEKTRPMNAMVIGMMSGGGEEAKAEFNADIKKWESGKEEINGDSATVFGKDPKEKDAVTLKKVDGSWKVDVQKKNSDNEGKNAEE